MESAVKLVPDKILCLHLPGTNFGYVVPIDNNIHQQSGAAIHNHMRHIKEM